MEGEGSEDNKNRKEKLTESQKRERDVKNSVETYLERFQKRHPEMDEETARRELTKLLQSSLKPL
ncbi:hypothetical protein DAI22_12g216500 [Oryza sativa Japonica Group]|nr:hypothetical protein DAI22_12g216500 [Oryza sativa Japonica Group]